MDTKAHAQVDCFGGLGLSSGGMPRILLKLRRIEYRAVTVGSQIEDSTTV